METLEETIRPIVNGGTYLACFVGVIFGIIWQGYEAQKIHKSNFKLSVFASENKWRWGVGIIGSFILVRYGMTLIIRNFIGVEDLAGYGDYVDITALAVGIFGFRLVKILMKKGDSKLNTVENNK